MVWFDSFFYSIQLSLRKLWFDSTNCSHRLYKNWIKISSRPKMDLWNLIQIDSWLKRYLIQINSRLKTLQNFDLNRLVAQKIWNIDSNQVMTQWFQSTVDFVDLSFFWAFTKFCWPSFRHSTQVPWFESAHASSSISKIWIDSTHDSSTFPGIDSESTHDLGGFPRH